MIVSESAVFVKMLKINEQCLMILKAKWFNCKKEVAHFLIIHELKQSSLFQHHIVQLTLCQRYRTILCLKLLSLSNTIVASLQYFYYVIDSEQAVFVKMLKMNEQCLMILKAKLFNCKKKVVHFIIIHAHETV
jgi:hypothetical protein